MPYAVTHVLVAIILAEIIRDYIVKDKKKFPLHYILIAGIAGLLPDVDVVFDIFNGFFGIVTKVHPSFTHSLLWIPIFLLLAFTVLGVEKKKGKGIKWLEKGFTKHHLKISGILFIVTFGIAVHLLLDGTLIGNIRLGFFTPPIGLHLLPEGDLGNMISNGMDAILLLLWLIHEEWKHKISSFI